MLRTLSPFAILALLANPLAADDDETPGAGPAAEQQVEAPARAIEPTPSELARYQLTDVPRNGFPLEGPSAGFVASGASMFAASAADILTTEWGLSQGFVEGNPVVQNRGVRIATHIAAPLAVYWATERLRRAGRGKLAFALRLSIMAAYSYAAVHNTRMIATNPASPF